jgi:hypothetical protein
MNKFLEKTLKPKKGKADGRWQMADGRRKLMKLKGKGQELGRVTPFPP